eukprot:366028-Chlamydomonas_euryale.AAC.1
MLNAQSVCLESSTFTSRVSHLPADRLEIGPYSFPDCDTHPADVGLISAPDIRISADICG